MTFTELRDPLAMIKELAQLCEEGIITEEEYEEQKRRLLERI
jgi:hypothetical protein